MGLFDFLKGKAKTSERKSATEADEAQSGLDDLAKQLGGKPRFWHHFLGHVALRDFALRGEGLPQRASTDAPAFFAWVLEEMAPHLGIEKADCRGLVSEIAVHRQRIGALDVAIVQMPPPQGPTECYFVCLIPASAQNASARYFTLEDAGGDVAVFGAWTKDEQHQFFDDLPEPTLAAFVAEIARRV